MIQKLCFTILINLTFLIQFSNAQVIIELDQEKTYQTIDGWGAIANPLASGAIRDTLLPHIDSLIHLAINEVGITRLKISLPAGAEDSVDYFQKIIDNEITYDDYKLTRYNIVNDNDDPFTADPSGFQMNQTKYVFEKEILPFKQLVENNNDDFYLNFVFVNFENSHPEPSDFNHADDPEEYAEFINYTWQFLDNEYGFTPDGLEVILEPDNTACENYFQRNLPPVIEALGNRFEMNGYEPEIMVPSTLSLTNVKSYFNEVEKNPDALKYVDVIVYHRYGGNNDTLAQAEIVELAEKHNLKTAMLEYDKNGDVEELHYDLKHNNVVAWTKYALMFKSDEKFAYVYVDENSGPEPKYGICKQTKYLRQYFKYIRPGALRFEVSTSDPEIDPVAFKNKDGKEVIVVKAEKGEEINIIGLEAGNYGIKYTLGNYHWGGVDPKEYDIELDDQTISEGDELRFNLPDQGVATIYQKSDLVSINNKSNNKLNIYPNPATEKINIEIDERINKVEIYDNLGNIVLISYKYENIDISTLSSGVYYVKINNTIKSKFIKK